MSRTRGSGLTPEQAEHLAEVLRSYLPRYGDNATAMARAWGISQPQLSQLLSGRNRGAGVAVLCRLRQHTERTIDDLLGLPALKPTLETELRQVVSQAIQSLRQVTEPHPVKPPPQVPAPPPTSRRLKKEN